jgi:hypothetical protein
MHIIFRNPSRCEEERRIKFNCAVNRARANVLRMFTLPEEAENRFSIKIMTIIKFIEFDFALFIVFSLNVLLCTTKLIYEIYKRNETSSSLTHSLTLSRQFMIEITSVSFFLTISLL